MTSDPSIALEVLLAPPKPAAGRFLAVLTAFWALTKPEINFLVLVAAFTGFYMGSPVQIKGAQLLLLAETLLGTLLVASSAGALNQYFERGFDSRMKRTAKRPLPGGKVKPSLALGFGILLALAGVIQLAVAVNGLTSLLSVATLAGYVGVYTPLKRITALSTSAGAIPGAMPPLIGWAAASGGLTYPAWLLYLTLFLWQFPHFMAIAWMYREDYLRAGFRVLPRCHADRLVFWQTLLPSAFLIPVSMRQPVVGGAGYVSVTIAGILSCAFFFYSAPLGFRTSRTAARRTLMASVIYLPLIFIAILLGKS